MKRLGGQPDARHPVGGPPVILPLKHCTDPNHHSPHPWTHDGESRGCPGTPYRVWALADVEIRDGRIPQWVAITTEEDPMAEYTSPDLPPPGTLLRDRDGDLWRISPEGAEHLERADGIRVPVWVVEWTTFREGYGPLTPHPAPAGTAYRDEDGDYWYSREDGRWQVSAAHVPGVRGVEFAEMAAEFGPLVRVPEKDVAPENAPGDAPGGSAGPATSWGVRGAALTEAAEVVKSSATNASADDLIRLAEWLMGGDQ